MPEFFSRFYCESKKPSSDGGVRVGEIMNVFREKTRRWFHDFGPALTVALIGGALSFTVWDLVVALETRLLVQVTPERSGFIADGHWLSWIVLIFGLLLSGGMAFIIQASGRHARDLEIKNLQFDAALNNMVQGLLMYDAAGHLIISNRRFAEIYGMPWETWSPACLGTTVPEGIKTEIYCSSQDARSFSQDLGRTITLPSPKLDRSKRMSCLSLLLSIVRLNRLVTFRCPQFGHGTENCSGSRWL